MTFQQKDITFHTIADPRATVEETRCPEGLTPNQVVYVGADVVFYGEKPIPVGMPVRFTRYVWDHMITSYMPIHKYAMFWFPDGTERSLQVGSFTLTDPNRSPVEPRPNQPVLKQSILRFIKRYLFRVLFKRERKVLVHMAFGYNTNWHSNCSNEEAAAYRMLRNSAQAALLMLEQYQDTTKLIELKPKVPEKWWAK